MTHPKQLDEAGITESYLRKMAKKEGVSYKRAVQIAMEQWGEYSLKLINKLVADDIKERKEDMKMSKEKVTASMIELWIGEGFDRRNRFQNTALESCFSILASVANGKYSVEELRENILSNNVSLK